MGFFDIVLRSLLSSFSLFILAKLMGRKQISQLNTFDYIIGITIGSIAAEMTVNKDVEYWVCIVAMTSFALIGVLISYVTTKSITLRRVITGVPIILIERGKIIEEGLNKARFDINDLLQECRANGYFDISEIEYAMMEANGRISFLLKSKYNPVTPNDMKLKVSNKGLCANLVIDGNIIHEHLKNINKDEDWLLTRLKKEGYENCSNILLLICDTKEKFTIYEKNINLYNSKVLE